MYTSQLTWVALRQAPVSLTLGFFGAHVNHTRGHVCVAELCLRAALSVERGALAATLGGAILLTNVHHTRPFVFCAELRLLAALLAEVGNLGATLARA